MNPPIDQPIGGVPNPKCLDYSRDIIGKLLDIE
jgi:hypothetical protein